MIKIFRKIRQNLLMENKTGKYFKYAIGEIVLVVIGILIALSINNWNESRKIKNKKQTLVLNLIEDFEENKILLELAINNSDTLILKMSRFFDNAYSDKPKISLDSIKVLSDGFFRPTIFFPLTTTYDEAKANGNITLLNNKELSQNFAEFQRGFNSYIGLSDQGLNSFFTGSVWELKKSIGTLDYIRGEKRIFTKKYLDKNEYKELINTPLVIATLENRYTLERNVRSSLVGMKFNSEKILEILKLL
jgi:soluble cytochrome b562